MSSNTDDQYLQYKLLYVLDGQLHTQVRKNFHPTISMGPLDKGLNERLNLLATANMHNIRELESKNPELKKNKTFESDIKQLIKDLGLSEDVAIKAESLRETRIMVETNLNRRIP